MSISALSPKIRRRKRIGIDFDNTIVGYDEIFVEVARREGLVPPGFQGRKQALRDAVRRTPDGEFAWQRLQGRVYGAEIASAVMFEGVDAFLRLCREADADVFIVSHKTEFGHHDPSRINLRQAAAEWMTARGFFRPDGFGIAAQRLFFEGSRQEKIDRIAALQCSHFIDDLEEVLCDPGFPRHVTRILFAQEVNGAAAEVVWCKTWREISEVVFGERG
jgi:hypothetical protein